MIEPHLSYWCSGCGKNFDHSADMCVRPSSCLYWVEAQDRRKSAKTLVTSLPPDYEQDDLTWPLMDAEYIPGLSEYYFFYHMFKHGEYFETLDRRK